MKRRELLLIRLMMVVGLTLVGWLAVSGLTGLAQVAAPTARSAANPAGASFLYRFDPMAQTFFTIPLSNGAVPIGVAVTGTYPTYVWIAEYGLDRITHVVFTNPANYTQTVYSITSTANSGPYRITVNGNEVWFTEREANRVGRLNAVTGQLDEFYGHGLPPNAGLSDIKVALDGTVWMGGQTVQRLIKLTISSPSVYAFTEFTDMVRPAFSVAPSFLTIDSNDSIWMTMPGATSHKLALYTPGAQSFTWPTLPSGSTPHGIATTPGLVWYADASRDRLGQISLGTYVIVNEYGPITDALEITAESANILWLTQQSGQGLIGRFIYTNTASTRYDSFALPTPGLRVTGVATVPGSGVWSVAYMPEKVYLPLVLR